MAWIESHQNLREHPKVYVLVDTLGVNKAQAIGHLHLLWWWCVDYAPEGVISQNDIAIARAAEWSGDPKLFVKSLVESGFADRTDGVLTVHDWGEYRLHYDLLLERQERQKEQTRERVRAFRDKKRSSNGRVTQCNAPTQTKQTKPEQTKPEQTQPNQTKPKRQNQTQDPLGLKRSLLNVVDVGSGGCGGENVNGNEISQSAYGLNIVERVVDFSGDPGSRAFFQKAVRRLGGPMVEEAMGEVRMREAEGGVENRAKYLVAVLDDWMKAKA